MAKGKRLSKDQIVKMMVQSGKCCEEEAKAVLEDPKMGIQAGMTKKQLKRQIERHL
jgi:polyhydroxyalkanoate synthesis regulator phasin